MVRFDGPTCLGLSGRKSSANQGRDRELLEGVTLGDLQRGDQGAHLLPVRFILMRDLESKKCIFISKRERALHFSKDMTL